MVLLLQDPDDYGNGTGIGVTIGYEGLTLGAYGAEENKATQIDDVQDEFNGSWFVNYNFGPVSIRYQETYFDAGLTHATKYKNKQNYFVSK